MWEEVLDFLVNGGDLEPVCYLTSAANPFQPGSSQEEPVSKDIYIDISLSRQLTPIEPKLSEGLFQERRVI